MKQIPIPKKGRCGWSAHGGKYILSGTYYDPVFDPLTKCITFEYKRAKELLRIEKEWKHDQETCIDLRPMEYR